MDDLLKRETPNYPLESEQLPGLAQISLFSENVTETGFPDLMTLEQWFQLKLRRAPSLSGCTLKATMSSDVLSPTCCYPVFLTDPSS
jgi:hypothetical protein